MRYLVLLLIFCPLLLLGQKSDDKLIRNINNIISGFEGEVGIYIKDLNSNKVVAIHADTLFPTASMIKVPILIGVMDKINRDELNYHQKMVYKDSLLYEGEDILGSFKHGEQIELSKLVMLMLTMSDNTASLWLQSLAGSGTRINALLDSLGYKNTRVNSRTPGREENRKIYGWGQTTPREMATLLESIYNGDIISRAACDRMLRMLNRNYWDNEAISQLPPYVTVFSKSGAVNQSRSEVVLVKGKKSHYVFCIITKNNKDESWDSNNKAWQLIRTVSKFLWNYYEPKDKWEPAPGAGKFN